MSQQIILFRINFSMSIVKYSISNQIMFFYIFLVHFVLCIQQQFIYFQYEDHTMFKSQTVQLYLFGVSLYIVFKIINKNMQFSRLRKAIQLKSILFKISLSFELKISCNDLIRNVYFTRNFQIFLLHDFPVLCCAICLNTLCTAKILINTSNIFIFYHFI